MLFQNGLDLDMDHLSSEKLGGFLDSNLDALSPIPDVSISLEAKLAFLNLETIEYSSQDPYHNVYE